MPLKDISPNADRPEKRVIHVAAQDWEAWSSIVCCSKAAEAKTGEVVGVPVVAHGGFLHCAFSAMYGGFSGVSKVDAWQLIPLDMHRGITWTYHDQDYSVRERGDYAGCRVAVRGKQMVCAKPVCVLRTYPTTEPISFLEAVAYEEESRRYGWRAMRYLGVRPVWKWLEGHPVAVYGRENPVERLAVLLWRHNGQTRDYHLPEGAVDHIAENIFPASPMPTAEARFQKMPAQGSLF